MSGDGRQDEDIYPDKEDDLLNVVILEDNCAEAAQLSSLVAEYPAADTFSVYHARSIREMDEYLEAHGPVHILLADIVLPGEPTGIQAVKERFDVSDCTQIIYVSGYLQAALDAYETDHVYFLLKPVQKDKLFDALDRALAKMQNAQGEVSTFVVKSKGQYHFIPQNTIRYIESDLRQLHIYTTTGVVDAYMKLDEAASQLPDTFVRCHRSFLVNITAVASLARDCVYLVDGTRVPVSKSHIRVTQEALLRYLG